MPHVASTEGNLNRYTYRYIVGLINNITIGLEFTRRLNARTIWENIVGTNSFVCGRKR